MRHWSEARRKALVDQAQRLEPMFGDLSTTVRDLGFDSWRFAVLDPNPLSPPLLMKTTLDDSFVDRYIEQRLYVEDPCYQHGRVSLQPLHWQPALFSQTPVLWQMMRDVGVNHGMSQACHHTNGWAAVLCFGRSRPELGADEFQDKASTLLSLTSHLAVATVEPVANDGTIGLPIRYMDKLLTKRESPCWNRPPQGIPQRRSRRTCHCPSAPCSFIFPVRSPSLGCPTRQRWLPKRSCVGISTGLCQTWIDSRAWLDQ